MKRFLFAMGLCVIGAETMAKDAKMHYMHGDARVQKVVYDPYAVVPLTGAFGYTMAVRFGEDEHIKRVSAGDTVAWQIVAKKGSNIVFLKPQEENPETNLVVFTDRRSYQFNLRAIRPKGFDDPRLTYRVEFEYPEDELLIAQQEAEAERKGIVQGAKAKSPTQFNFKYSFKGSSRAAPIQTFDDGEFTYFRFAEHENVPAVFLVDSDKKETLVNYRREGEWLVVERVARQYTLRANNNRDVACVFNDAFPQREQSSLASR